MVGRYFEDRDARYCILGDIRPGNLKATPGEQTREVMETIQKSLVSAGMDFQNVVRTWFYNDRILDWYAEFNRARSTFFQRHGITAIPASTGIGVANRAGAALVAKAIAVAPKNGHATIRRVESPLQCEASAYGSAFSRALEVADRAARVLYVSGTASIEANGDTAHVGNATKQIAKTMEVVEAILERNGMSLGETVRAIGYFRHREHIPLWEEYCRGRELAPMPIILTECEVCRANLLFEIELDVATAV
jgi:enamine deaminase RidA (YjgF/YER057c/UK114 family)